MVTIRWLYEHISGLPSIINIILEDDTHPYIGNYETAPEKFKDSTFKSAVVRCKDYIDVKQVVFYI